MPENGMFGGALPAGDGRLTRPAFLFAARAVDTLNRHGYAVAHNRHRWRARVSAARLTLVTALTADLAKPGEPITNPAH